MKKIVLGLLLACNIIVAQNEEHYIKNQLIVKLKQSAFQSSRIDLAKNSLGVASLDKLSASLSLKSIRPIGNYKVTKMFLLIFNEGTDVTPHLKKFEKSREIEFAEINFMAVGGGQINTGALQTIPTDTYFNRQWGLLNNGTLNGIGTVVAGADVDMELAWDIQTGDPEMIIAVSDTGLKMNHPDIASRIWVNGGEIPDNGIDDDDNGYIDDTSGWDWVNGDNIPNDDHGHGSNCTGIIGCIANNNSLFAGANWNSRIMPLKVLGANNNGSYADMAESIFYAVDNGAKVVSMSIGGSAPSAAVLSSIAYANDENVMLFFCMMNNNNNVSYYPARYSLNYSNVMAVGSTNPDDKRTNPFFWSTTSGSSYGTHINVVAPGNFIYGLSNTSDTTPNSYWGGTSQATPLVAGIASLMFAQNPALTPANVRSILQNTAVDQLGISAEDVPGFDQYMGYGRVNAFAALQATLSVDEYAANQQELQLINPIKSNELQVYSQGNFAGDYTATIYTIDGKKLFSSAKNIVQGLNTIPFDYPSGNYILELKNDGYEKVFKVRK